MWQKRWMWILWPAFLAAGVLEVLVFAFVDPQDLDIGGLVIDSEASRLAVYTLAFFAFWLVLVAVGYLMALLARPGEELNARSS